MAIVTRDGPLAGAFDILGFFTDPGERTAVLDLVAQLLVPVEVTSVHVPTPEFVTAAALQDYRESIGIFGTDDHQLFIYEDGLVETYGLPSLDSGVVRGLRVQYAALSRSVIAPE